MKDLTTGSVTRHLLQTSGFMLVTMLFQTLYFLVDLYWVGRLGKEAVAGVGVAGNLMFVVLAMTQMLGVGTTTLISHAAGRKEPDRALLVFNQSQVLSVFVGIAFFSIAMLGRGVYVDNLSADAETARLADEYLRWFIPATALQFAMVSMAAALRGTGNFMPGMIVQSATVVLNMILAPFLIFGWFTDRPMGVAGAALATLIAIAIGTAWLLTYFIPRESYLRFMRADWKPQLALWGQLLKIGLPAGAEFALMAVYLFVIYAISRPFGAAAQAGFGIGMRVMQAGFMPVVALGFSVAPVAGQNFGAHHLNRVREVFRSAVLLSIAVMAVFALLCHVAPAAMIRLFSSDPQVVAVGDEYLRIVSWNFVAAGIVFVVSSMFQALGNTIPSLISSFVRLLVLVVPGLLLSRMDGFQLYWIWYLSVAAVTVQMILSLLLLRREFVRKLSSPVNVPSPVIPIAAGS
ncbi:MAG: MATE family efflux transporter [Candidatus Eisenbacteria bacterium]|uniref:Multidrug-efflux transporter n=1 Tax=Eiseniibacteriota bacterium TaxID=2212470 RepID=A0A849SP62_UNCEI|nr:MATE family efflux transporter [Candidatus Eisenbacteria bacterium]